MVRSVASLYPSEVGYDDAEGKKTVLSLTLAAAGPTRGILINLTVADLHDLQQRLTTRFNTDYACLARWDNERLGSG
jgi:hypothetical protein